MTAPTLSQRTHLLSVDPDEAEPFSIDSSAVIEPHPPDQRQPSARGRFAAKRSRSVGLGRGRGMVNRTSPGSRRVKSPSTPGQTDNSAIKSDKYQSMDHQPSKKRSLAGGQEGEALLEELRARLKSPRLNRIIGSGFGKDSRQQSARTVVQGSLYSSEFLAQTSPYNSPLLSTGSSSSCITTSALTTRTENTTTTQSLDSLAACALSLPTSAASLENSTTISENIKKRPGPSALKRMTRCPVSSPGRPGQGLKATPKRPTPHPTPLLEKGFQYWAPLMSTCAAAPVSAPAVVSPIEPPTSTEPSQQHRTSAGRTTSVNSVLSHAAALVFPYHHSLPQRSTSQQWYAGGGYGQSSPTTPHTSTTPVAHPHGVTASNPLAADSPQSRYLDQLKQQQRRLEHLTLTMQQHIHYILRLPHSTDRQGVLALTCRQRSAYESQYENVASQIRAYLIHNPQYRSTDVTKDDAQYFQ